MRGLARLCFAAFLAVTSRAAADCGGIAFLPQSLIFEPNQRALIAYNGKEEILLLSQDMKVSKPTKVLQVLPLPSEPKVTQGDFAAFIRATNLINQRLARPAEGGGAGGGVGGLGGTPIARPAGEVTFHDKIGSHDISVTHVLHSRGFIEWVEKLPAEVRRRESDDSWAHEERGGRLPSRPLRVVRV